MDFFEYGDEVVARSVFTPECWWIDTEPYEGVYIGDLAEELEESVASAIAIYEDGKIVRYLLAAKSTLELKPE